MEKVKECYNNAEMYQCQRCAGDTDREGWYCNNCNPPQEVDFDVGDENLVLSGTTVCPYCYNQLVDENMGEEQDEVKNNN